MSNNIAIGTQVGKGVAPISFADANIVAANTNEVILVDEEGYHFFNPNNGSIPQISGFDTDKSYLINSKVDRDLRGIVDTVSFIGVVAVNVLSDSDGNMLVDSDGTLIEAT